jgi:hypothetical protein
VQRPAHELLGDLGTVGVGGVEQVDAEVGRAAHHGDGGVGIGRWTPDTRSGEEAHRAETEPVHRPRRQREARAESGNGVMKSDHAVTIAP